MSEPAYARLLPLEVDQLLSQEDEASGLLHGSGGHRDRGHGGEQEQGRQGLARKQLVGTVIP
jgi:hypothetical protein